MDKIKVNGIELYVEEHGLGEPLLLIEGLGYANWSWFRQKEEFAKHFRTIIFDNRGVGDSDKPDEPYSIELLAEDAAGVLSALGIKSAHILGVSMGGFIAQQLAISYPSVVRSLVLSCTSFGGPNSLPITQEAQDSMLKISGLSIEEMIRHGLMVAFAEQFAKSHAGIIEKIIFWRMEKPTPRYAWERQYTAAGTFNIESKLTEIKVPTLIITGLDDRVLPSQNSILLKEHIPEAKLIMIPDAGHLFFIEKSEEYNRIVLSFLKSLSN